MEDGESASKTHSLTCSGSTDSCAIEESEVVDGVMVDVGVGGGIGTTTTKLETRKVRLAHTY